MSTQAIYPGTFDPLTYGHLDIIIRSNKIFDQVLLAIAENPQKKPLFNITERIVLAKQATQKFPNVTVFGFNDLTANIMKIKKINVLIRGIRNISDFDYEIQLAKINHYFNSNIETIFMISTDTRSCISSKLIKEIAQQGGKIDHFIPNFIAEQVINKLYKPKKNKLPLFNLLS